jgi:hypothetical protein
MEISWVYVSKDLNSRYQVGVEFEACPVGGHNYHRQVERSIREVKSSSTPFTAVSRWTYT